MFGYSPVVPLQIDKQDGIKLNKSFEEVAKQNLLMLILTNPGERIMYPDFGVGLKSFLFENHSEVVAEEIKEAIRDQTSVYLPYIILNNVQVIDQPDLIESNILDPNYSYLVKINYAIDFLGVQDIVEIEL